MITVPLTMGTRVVASVPLVDAEAGVTLACADGAVVALDVRWPDHPAVARPRLTWLACQAAVDRAMAAPGGLEALPPATFVDLVLPRDEAITAYAVALVVGWNQPAACTPDAVAALFADNPFALGLVLAASGDADRFLPPSLRPSASTLPPVSEAVAA